MSSSVIVRWRIVAIVVVLVVMLLGLLSRLFYLSVFDRSFLLNQSKLRILRTVTLPAYRGMVLDRSGTPLAISVPLDSLCLNPQEAVISRSQYGHLSQLLHVSAARVARRLRLARRSGKEFLYLKRMNPPAIAAQALALHIPGLFIRHEFKRYYPEGAVMAHVVGLTNIDDSGQEGLELAYNRWLSGRPGKKEVLKDRLGHVIENVAVLHQPVQGRDLVLSIDHRIQFLAYHALSLAVKKYHAQSGSVVVLDVQTGEILAMVNQPSYNPNNRPASHTGNYRNRAVTDSFEPGSTMKPFTIALALASGKYTPQSIVNTSPGRLKVGGYVIKDDGLDYGKIDLTQILQKSSNIGAAKILLSLSPQRFWDLLRKLGFGLRSHSNYPGESPGTLVSHTTWYPSVIATLAYGYGIAVTTLQLAHAYAVLANKGVNEPVTFLKRSNPVPGIQVLSSQVARRVIQMLRSVVEVGGTGRRARVPGYHVAGKTGTAYIAGPHGYNKKRFMASFVGVAPAGKPRLVVAVVLRDPQGQHFGGIVAAPIFSQVMGGALRFLDISPLAHPSGVKIKSAKQA